MVASEFVFDVDEIQRFEGGEFVAGDDRGHGIADEPDVIDAERVLVLADGKDAVFDGDVFAGEDEMHARVGEGPGGVDGFRCGRAARVERSSGSESMRGSRDRRQPRLAGDLGAGVNTAFGIYR